MKVLIHRLLTLFVVILATSISSEVFAKKIEVHTFTPGTIKDASVEGIGIGETVVGGRSILHTISSVNKYIWFLVGFFCFVFMIWNGYKLITANGDEKAMKSAKTALLGSVVGFAVCILAYIIVNLAVRLFA